MASIHKRSGRKYWYAHYRDAGGKQRFVSLKIEHSPKAADPEKRKKKTGENKRLAIEAAQKLEALELGNPTESHFRKLLEDISGRLRESSIEFPTVEKYLNAWLETRQLAPSTRERYRKPIADFLEYLGSRAELPISNVTPSDVTEWGRRKVALGYSAVTVRTDRKAISPAFAQATREGLLLTNPVTLAEPIEGESEKREPFTREEVARLTEATAGTEWGTVVRIAAATGLRLGDAVNLKWEDFDLFNGILDIRPEKSRRKKRNLKIPLAGSLREYLAGLGPRETGKLTPELSQLESKGNGAASKAFLKIMEAEGIDSLPVQAEGKGRTFHRKSFHAFRHFFISELGRRGVPSDVSQALAGHSSPAVHAAYKHFDPETLAEAVSTL